MRARWMSKVTLPVVLIAAAAAPAGASASAGFVPSSAPPVGAPYQHTLDRHDAAAALADVPATNGQSVATDGFEWADAGACGEVLGAELVHPGLRDQLAGRLQDRAVRALVAWPSLRPLGAVYRTHQYRKAL